MSALYLVRDVATGHFINEKPAEHDDNLFVPDIDHAFIWDNFRDAKWLAVSLSHNGRKCEVVEIHPSRTA